MNILLVAPAGTDLQEEADAMHRVRTRASAISTGVPLLIFWLKPELKQVFGWS